MEAVVAPGLKVSFHFQGKARVPAPAAPRFADGLWQHTCFEVFVARQGMPDYREFNFSPSGEWAAYAFAAYRSGMTRLDVRPAMEFRGDVLEAAIPLEPGPWRAGLAAVMEDEDGTRSYWALRHPPGRPDFHHPDAFVLDIG